MSQNYSYNKLFLKLRINRVRCDPDKNCYDNTINAFKN